MILSKNIMGKRFDNKDLEEINYLKTSVNKIMKVRKLSSKRKIELVVRTVTQQVCRDSQLKWNPKGKTIWNSEVNSKK